jgi:hypothetical protein
MNELLTPEDKKYLERVSRYIQSLGKKEVAIRIEANEWDSKTEISDIEWDTITNFDYDSRLDIPSGFIEILQKIFNYLDSSGNYSFPDIEGLNYHDFLIEFNVSNKELSIKQVYGYYDVGGESEVEFEGDEVDMDSFREELNSGGIEIPEDGILTARYNGGGDDGSMDGSFDEISGVVPSLIEDFCYTVLSNNFGGWENNEGGEGYFMFDFNNDSVTLYHTENVEENDSNTLFEVEF